MRAKEFTKHINKSRIFENTSQLPPNVIELIKKIAQSAAAPEHKKAMIDSLITKYRDKQGVPEGFDELDAYIKDKQAVKPSGGAGIKRGSYGTGERKTGYSGKTVGLNPYGTGSAIPSNRDFGRPHSVPRAAPRGIDDYDANYRREIDEIQQGVAEDQLDEACWKGYHKEGMKTMFGKRYPNCVKNKNESLETYIRKGECPGCGGVMVAEGQLTEKQDACYHKVKSRYKVWPSAYASGALVQCRKKGAANWGNKSESITQEEYNQLDENLKQWFSDKWVRFGPDGKIRGDCARGDSSEGKPKCLPQSKAHALGKKGRASAAARKRREDPNPERSGKAINVNTKKKSNEGVAEGLPPMGFVRSEIKRDPLKNPTRTYIEISKMLGITPRQLQGFTLRNAGFPSPIKGIGRQAGRGTNNYYELNQVKQWIKDNHIKDQIAALVSKNIAKDQGMTEDSDDFEVRLDGKTVPGPFNDFDHARNKASKLISYQKGKVAEVYVNGKLKMRLKLNTPHQHFDEHTAA